MRKSLKPMPYFTSEAEERPFWESQENDGTEFVDWSDAKPCVFPNLKPTTRAISLRLPAGLLDSIKIEANERDVPYQSLIKIWLNEKLKEAHGHRPWLERWPSSKNQ